MKKIRDRDNCASKPKKRGEEGIRTCAYKNDHCNYLRLKKVLTYIVIRNII
jgi:hypothetical protein